MLMGTAQGGELKDLSAKIKFVEDMTQEEKTAAMKAKGSIMSAGHENLGVN